MSLTRPVPIGSAFFLLKCLELIILALLCVGIIGVLLRLRHGRLAAASLQVTVALYVTMLAVSLGGDFLTPHCLFAVPLYVAVAAGALERLAVQGGLVWKTLTLAIVVGLLVVGALSPHYDYQKLQPAYDREAARRRLLASVAGQIDEVMSACGFRRYLFNLATNHLADLQGYTQHSPYQLTYGLQRAQQRVGPLSSIAPPVNPFLRSKLLRDLNEAPLIVTDNPDQADSLLPEFDEVIARRFTPKAPACAEGLLPTEGIQLLFRAPEPRGHDAQTVVPRHSQ